MDAEATPQSTVKEHVSRHDSIGDLPLVTKSARVTGVAAMDHDREAEVTAAINDRLESAGLARSLAGPEDWEHLRDELISEGRAKLVRRLSTLAGRYGRPKPMLVRVRLRTEATVDYLAGQYVGIRYGGTSRAYSLSSSPTQAELELCVRRVPGGRLSPELCGDMSVGDKVTVRGPYGDLVLGEQSQRDIVFLATGTGVAPFKGMIDYLFETGRDEHRGHQRDVWLFLGAAWEDDLPYRERFREYAAERENFHFVPCLSRERVLTDWDGETDYVQHALLKHTDGDAVTAPLDEELERWLRTDPESGVEARLDPSNVDVYACGINAMVHSLVLTAERLGVPPERIESEGFG